MPRRWLLTSHEQKDERASEGRGGAAAPRREGTRPDGDGWFIVNIAESQGAHTERFGDGCMFEGRIGTFPELGVNVRVLHPGQPAAMYHREGAQEASLVLSGECVAIVENEERPMRKGDFLHSPPGTAHVLVGAGEEPCTRSSPESRDTILPDSRGAILPRASS